MLSGHNQKETDEKSSIFSNFNCTFQRCFVPFKNRKDLKKRLVLTEFAICAFIEVLGVKVCRGKKG